ncbi:MAG: polysaccharide pyruvyl transferase family protein [Ruminococcus sp.]|nr:polysaccharide pyruvyl transferase family protein [Ruminococcus sp.]
MLLNALSKYGKADFIDTKSRSSEEYLRKDLVQNITRLRFRRAIFDYKSTKKFLEKQAALPVADLCDIPSGKEDIFVFGSDEIWNVARNAFSKYPIFWGAGIKNPKFSYAPSINFSTKEQLREYGISDYLNEFSSISVRDDYSQRVLAEVAGISGEKVVDPTMLFPREYYLKNFRKSDLPCDNYIAVYVYLRKNDKQVTSIREVAKRLGKKLVSVGLYNSWCDYCVTSPDINPFVYYENADYVISSTFHGIAFAITFQKNFVAVLNGKSNKVSSMLADFELSDRAVYTSDVKKMTDVLITPIDYNMVESKLERMRRSSYNYIESSIDKVNHFN